MLFETIELFVEYHTTMMLGGLLVGFILSMIRF
jgi:hypothetical protein